MSKLKIDKKTLVFIALAIFLLIELAVFLPFSLKRVVGINKETARLKKNLQDIGREWPNKDNYAGQQDELTSEIAALRGRFIGADDESRLLSFISQAGKDHGVEIQSMSPAELITYPDNTRGQFYYFPVKISARSRYHNLARFFDFIQNSRYFFEVKEIAIKSASPYNVVDMTVCGLLEKQ